MKMHTRNSAVRPSRVANLALVLIAASSISCSSGEAGTEPGGAVVDQTKEPLWFVTGAATWPGGSVRVCFQSGSFTTAQRSLMRQALENGWEGAAEINFWDFGNCPQLNDSTTDIVAVINEPGMAADAQHMHCENGGAASCDVAAGKAPLGEYNKIRIKSANPSNKLTLRMFGHALGFETETANQGNCNQRTSGATSLENQGDVLNSVMVEFPTCNSATTLSAWDILGARAVYGRKIAGTFQGRNNLCLNINGASTANGANIMGFPCNGVFWNQRWFRPGNSLLAFAHPPSGPDRCLNVAGGVVLPNFTPLISWDCSEAFLNEHLHFTAMQWRAMGNRCLQADSSATGAKISIQTCGTSALQKWDFFERDFRIRLNNTGMCVNVPNGSTANGTELILWPCSTGTPFPNETFGFTEGFIMFADKVFNVAGGTTTNGNRLILWPQVGTHNDRFTIKGQITMMGQCVDTQDAAAPELGQMVIRACSSLSQTQQWEYWW